MARMSPDSLAGYILEELIAYLIRNSGYRLLVDAAQDPGELVTRANGLNVIGRGALHQVDVLGELSWIPAFTFPLRLIIEAKCRRTRTGTNVIREMMATLIDVNQRHFPSLDASSTPPKPKYTYVGAIFAASGFSSGASKLALAHAISLVDLNTRELSGLVKAARDSAVAVLRPANVRAFAASDLEIVRSIRRAIRLRLGTLPEPFADVELAWGVAGEDPLTTAVNTAQDTSELFVGMATGPYILLLKADNPKRFLEFSQDQPTHEVHIHWSRREDGGRTWSVEPMSGAKAYRLWFKLPDELASWIFNSESARKTALVAKEQFFSSISIYRHLKGRDSLIRLQYRAENTFNADAVSE
jgi:hypothetical protein